jgi:predicted amidophosphoribosyltransferase
MKKCEKCKAEVMEGANFCPTCGEALTSVAERIKKEDRRGALLEVVLALIDKIKDPNDLEVLNSLLKKLKP